MSLDVAGFGEAMALFQPPPGIGLDTAASVSVSVAGAELTVCAAVARLGLTASFVSRVGDDPLGRRVLAAASALGVGTDLVTVDTDRPTGLFLREARPDGRRRVHYYRAGSAASALDGSDAARLLAAGPRVVVVSGITASLGPGPLAAVRRLAEGAADLALDPNLRPALGPVEEQAARLRPLLPRVRYLLLGLDEAGPLFGVDEPAAVFAAAAAAGVGETVLKAGADGCHVPGAHVPALAGSVVDPVGAGDAFAGGYLAGRLRGAPPVAAARLGARLAAGVVARAGDTEGLPAPEAARAMLAEAVVTRPG